MNLILSDLLSVVKVLFSLSTLKTTDVADIKSFIYLALLQWRWLFYPPVTLKPWYCSFFLTSAKYTSKATKATVKVTQIHIMSQFRWVIFVAAKTKKKYDKILLSLTVGNSKHLDEYLINRQGDFFLQNNVSVFEYMYIMQAP